MRNLNDWHVAEVQPDSHGKPVLFIVGHFKSDWDARSWMDTACRDHPNKAYVLLRLTGMMCVPSVTPKYEEMGR